MQAQLSSIHTTQSVCFRLNSLPDSQYLQAKETDKNQIQLEIFYFFVAVLLKHSQDNMFQERRSLFGYMTTSNREQELSPQRIRSTLY